MNKQCNYCNQIKDESNFYNNGNLTCKKCHKIVRKIKTYKKMSYDEKIFNLIHLYSKGKPLTILSQYFECDIKDLSIWFHINQITDQSKKCGKCFKIKNRCDFAKQQQNPSGWCKECVRLYNTDYYIENSQYLKESSSEYYDNYDEVRTKQNIYMNNNKEKISKIQKLWRNNNSQAIKEYYTLYYEINKERLIEYQYIYREENRGLSNFWKSKYRSAKKQAIPPWVNFDKVKQIYEQATQLTIKTGIIHHVDHIIPLQHDLVSGLHVETNLQILTTEENIRKSNKFEPIIGSQK